MLVPATPNTPGLERIPRLLSRDELTEFSDVVAECAYASLHLESSGADPHGEVGGSRIGGDPDLPHGFEWPIVDNSWCQGPSAFLAQINLAKLPVHGPLPRTGLLSLFCDCVHDPSGTMNVRLFHFGDGTPLKRRTRPAEYADELLTDVEATAVEFSVVADVAWTQLRRRLSRDDFDDVFEALEARDVCVGRMLIDASDYSGGDVRMEALLGGMGRGELSYYTHLRSESDLADALAAPSLLAKRPGVTDAQLRLAHVQMQQLERMRPDIEWWIANRPALIEAAGASTILLELKSDNTTNLWFNDADPMFVIAADDAFRAEGRINAQGIVLQG